MPFPYIKFTSKFLKIDRNKINKVFFSSNNMKIELSVSGSLPSKSKNTLRAGMEDLAALIEVGPKLIYKIMSNKKMKTTLQIPIRFAYSIDDFDYQGVITSLDLNYRNTIFNGYKFGYSTGFGYSNKKFNNYYYEVPNKYATISRNEYHAKGGYSGFHSSLSLTKEHNSIWYGAFVKHYYLKNVVFEESPVVETKHALFYGLAFSYIF